jgi:hypothetical protein
MAKTFTDFDEWTAACKGFDGPFSLQGRGNFEYRQGTQSVALWNGTTGTVEGEPLTPLPVEPAAEDTSHE